MRINIDCNCIDINTKKRVEELKKQIDYEECYFADYFCTYNEGETSLSDGDKELIVEAYELRGEISIINSIFFSAHEDGKKSMDIFNFMTESGMIIETNHQKSTEGPKYAKIFNRCKGHYGENKSNSCCGYYCYDCKSSNLGMCMEGFKHCCCFEIN